MWTRKVRLKISSGFRSEEGTKDFAILLSMPSKARKHGRNPPA